MAETRAFVDRIEGDKAVLLVGENEEHTVVVPVEILPDGVREGAILTMTLRFESERTDEAKAHVSDLIDRLRKRR